MNKPIININELKFEPQSHGESFEAMVAPVANCIGAKKLGYRMVKVPPCKTAWPYHSHLVNEEMFFIIEGEGKLVQSGNEYQIKKGDVISAVAGKDKPHEIINTGQVELVYMAVSTMEEPDVCFYPKSGKFGVIAGSPPGRSEEDRDLLFFGRESDGVGYWDGES